ncbi:unnamed protein product [Cochlearia groenlandica]
MSSSLNCAGDCQGSCTNYQVCREENFDMENGPKADEFIQDAVLRMPPLRPLCLILKVFLQQRELNEMYSGGTGSFALLAMLIAFLKVKFFDFYGRKLNTADVGISCKMGACFFSKSNKGFLNATRPGLISIEESQTPENDIGKNSFNYFQAILALGPNRSILGTIIRPDRIMLERKGGQNGDVTFNSLLPGAGEPLPMPSNDKSNGGLLCNFHLDEDEESSFPRGSGRAKRDVITTLVVDTPGNKTKESSRKKTKIKKSKNTVVDDDDEEEKESSSRKKRRKSKSKI